MSEVQDFLCRIVQVRTSDTNQTSKDLCLSYEITGQWCTVFI